MPALRDHVAALLARISGSSGAGGDGPMSPRERAGALLRSGALAARRAARKSETLTRARRWAMGRRQQVSLEVAGLRSRLGARGGDGRSEAGPDPARMVWIFGSGRSGSTWLRSMMGEMGGHRVWEEPMVGRLFGEFYDRAPEANRRSADFVMGDPIRKGWTRSVRRFVLDAASYSHPEAGPEDYLIVKEPNGSVGAPIILGALPESRVILLIRDPRDVVASVLDAARKGGWLQDWQGRPRRASLADRNPDRFVRQRARIYLQSVRNAVRAYGEHKGPKVLVRYEELRSDTLNVMRRVYAELGVPADEGELARAVRKHAWEAIPKEEKGGGRFYRKATPGGWREDLTPRQAEIVEKVTADFLEEFYPSP